MKSYPMTVILALLLFLAACGRGGDSAPDITEDIQPVTIEELALRELDDFITVSGKLEGATNVTMSSEASGLVLQVSKKLGDRVSRGESIARIDNQAYLDRLAQARAGLESAATALRNAEKNRDYAVAAFEGKLISQAEYNTAISAYNGAKAGLDGARAGVEQAQMAVNGTMFKAPEPGVISNLNITAGQFIAAGMPVATIVNDSRLVLKTGVGESQIAKLKKGQTAEISYPGLEAPVRGTVRGFGISPLPGSATYPVEIDVASSQGLLPGMVVTAKILTNSYKDLLYSTLTYFSNDFGRTYAFVIDADNIAQKREVKLGRVIGEFVLIESGLNPGERIVTSGAENLEEGSKVEIRK